MAREWTPQDRNARRRELIGLYEHQKLPVAEIASALGLKPGTIYSRLRRLGIPTRTRVEGKNSHNARIIQVPALSGDLAEFCGIILGDGHVGSGQLWVSVNAHTDLSYVPYVQDLFERLFSFRPRLRSYRQGKVNLYLTSSFLVRELRTIGLRSPNKVRDQVGVPGWIFGSPEYQRRFIRGLFDTDGSIYRLKRFHAVQMSFSNRSMPLLEGTREALLDLGFHPSRVSDHSVYLTRRREIERYVQEIGFGNAKHQFRARAFGIPVHGHTTGGFL